MRFRISAGFQREFDVLADRDIGDQVESLENKADFLAQVAQLTAFECGDVAAVDHHMTARRSFQQVDGAHQRGFACSGETHDAEDFAFFHADVHMFDRFDGSSAFMKGHGHVVEFNNAHDSFLVPFKYVFTFVRYVSFDTFRLMNLVCIKPV